jgi:hypothetical protein
VKVLGVGNERKKGEQAKRVSPPENAGRGIGGCNEKGGQIGGHEEEDQKGDDAGPPGDLFAEPDGMEKETSDEEGKNGDGASQGEEGGEIVVEATKRTAGQEKTKAETDGAVVERNQGKRAEGPENECVSEAGKRPFANDFGLAEDFPEEVPEALAEVSELKAGVRSGAEDSLEDKTKTSPKAPPGCNYEGEKDHLLEGREALWFSQCWEV